MNYSQRLLTLLITVALTCTALVGCSTTGGSDTRNALLTELAIKAATTRIIDKSDDPAGRASRIIEISRATKGLAEGGVVTLIGDLELEINDRIDWQSLNPGDAMLAKSLVSAVTDELESRVDNNLIAGSSLLILQTVLDHIIEAAAMYETEDSSGEFTKVNAYLRAPL